MKRLSIFIPLLCIFSLSCQTPMMHGKGKPSKLLSSKSVATKINDLLSPYDSKAKIGVQIESLHSGRHIYGKNQESLFTPASVLKLFTVASALHYLGPHHRFHTRLATDKIEKKGHSIHDLLIEGGGDPGLMDHDIDKMASALKQMGIKAIKGDILIDDAAFDRDPWGAGWMWDDLHNGYSAPISALNVNHNQIVYKILPGQSIGSPVRVVSLPFTQYASIKIGAKTARSGIAPSLEIETLLDGPQDSLRILQAGLSRGQEVLIDGNMPIDGHERYMELSIREPSFLAASILKESLKKHGIAFSGSIRRQTAGEDMIELTSHTSTQLSEALINYNKVSNNHAIECLVKAVGAEVFGEPGTFRNGLAAIRQFLSEQAKMDIDGFLAADGSGTTRYNLTSPAHMVELLTYAWNDFRIGPEFVASLPLGGLDGTLSHRLNDEHIKGKVRAKTGNMTGVSSLAGYATTSHGEVLAFAILINDFVGSSAKYRKLQEDILEILVEG